MKMRILGLVTIVMVLFILGFGANVPSSPSVALAQTAAPTLPAANAGTTLIRFVHAAPNAPKVDVVIDGSPTPAYSNLGYGTVTAYLSLPSGAHKIALSAGGKSVYETSVTLPGATALTLTATGIQEATDSRAFTVVAAIDNVAPPTKGMARIDVIHASPLDVTVKEDNGNPVDVVVLDPKSGDIVQTLFQSLTFGQVSKEIEIPAGDYRIGVAAPSGQKSLIADLKITVQPDTLYTIVATGYNGSPKVDFKLLIMQTLPVTGYTAPAGSK